MENLWRYVDAYDCLQNANGDPPMPFELSREGLMLLEDFKHGWFYDGQFGDEEILHIATEKFLEGIIDTIESKLANKSKVKLVSLFGHDHTIVSFMKALNWTQPGFPHFASMIMIEVFYNDKMEPYFLLSYEGWKIDFSDMFDCIDWF